MEAADKCQQVPVVGAQSYISGTSTPAGNTTSASTYLANTKVASGGIYMLPALYSPVSLTCLVAPLTPASCPNTAVANRIMLGDITTTETTCQALGGCWSASTNGPSCFFSDTNVTPVSSFKKIFVRITG
jgi:hypothetical protein